MKSPTRRLELFVCGEKYDQLEVLILGSLSDTAPVHALVQSILNSWPGFTGAESITVESVPQGPQVQIGIAVKLSNAAGTLDPIAEALTALREGGIALANGYEWHTDSSRRAVCWW